MSGLPATVEELQQDREHGASWMARRAVETLLEIAEEPFATSEALVEGLIDAGRKLAESRPGVGAIAGATGRVLAAANAHRFLDVGELRRLIGEEGEAVLDGRRRAGASIAIQLQERLKDSIVATHSASATVREALLHTPPTRAICTVSKPIGEGRAFADELRAEGLSVDLVEDAEAPEALAEATVFLIGADTVFRDGTLCNKIGTTALAEAAQRAGTPTVVACEIVKLAPIDAASAPELSEAERTLFEMTSPELITEIVTEEGCVTSDGVGALVDRTPFLREGYALLLPANAL
jgi:translation initiation factor 2B subunit (eIF-2B alpha/beta/delta family)